MSYDDTDLPSQWVTTDEIDKLLNEARPNHYDKDHDDWLDEVEGSIGDRIAPAEARTIAARALVRRREQAQLKKANREVGKWITSGQWALDVFDLHRLPIALGDGTKVRLGFANQLDLVRCAEFQRSELNQRIESSRKVIAGYERLAELVGDGRVEDVIR